MNPFFAEMKEKFIKVIMVNETVLAVASLLVQQYNARASIVQCCFLRQDAQLSFSLAYHKILLLIVSR